MSMKNTDRDFYGKQTDENILYVVHPHSISVLINLVRVYAVSFIVFLVFVILGTQIGSLSLIFFFFGLTLLILMAIFGTKIVIDNEKRNVAYITNRRIVRFEPTTLFATNSRTLAWDEAVKVKTYPPNFIWKQLAIGTVAIHARTSIRTAENTPIGTVTADDIELKDVYYYRDLGNYIDKILFTYKQKPSDLDQIRPFIPKPKGERY